MPNNPRQLQFDPKAWPDVATWRKVLEQAMPLIGAILVAIGTGNWVAVGTEALKDVPSILLTLGLGGTGLMSILSGPLMAFLNNRSRSNGQALFDATANAIGLFDAVDPNGPVPVPVPGPVSPVPAPRPVNPNETHLVVDSPATGIRLDLTIDSEKSKDGGAASVINTLSAALRVPKDKLTLETTATPSAA